MGAATKAKLSQSYAERIKPGASDEFHWDTTLPGFGLKVTTSGRSTWVFQRQVVGGKKPRLTLGSFPSMDFNHARQAAMAMTCQIESGENPKTIRTIEQKQAFTVEDVMEVYAKKEMKEVTRRNLRLFLDKHIYPKYRDWFIKDFTRGVLIKWIEDDYSRLPGTAFNLITYISAAWKYASIRELIPAEIANPAFGVKKMLVDSGFKLRKSENGYKMTLEEADVGKLIAAIKDSYTDNNINPIAVAVIEMILHTGARRNEIQTLRFDEIDYEKRLITKRDPGKNGLTRYIRLSDAAISVLDQAAVVRVRKDRQSDEWVFPSGRAGHKNAHSTAVNEYLRRVGTKCGMPTLKPHNLRSLYINLAIDAGVPVPVVAENVGHSNVMTTMLHYLKNKQSSLFDGINTVGELLSKIGTMED